MNDIDQRIQEVAELYRGDCETISRRTLSIDQIVKAMGKFFNRKHVPKFIIGIPKSVMEGLEDEIEESRIPKECEFCGSARPRLINFYACGTHYHFRSDSFCRTHVCQCLELARKYKDLACKMMDYIEDNGRYVSYKDDLQRLGNEPWPPKIGPQRL